MKANNKFINFFREFSFIYSFLYLIFAFLLYLPLTYFFLFFITKSANTLSFETQKELVFDLVGFFLHLSDLNQNLWNLNEIIHYTDVRFIYDILFLIFLGCLFFLFYFKINYKKIPSSIKRTLFVIHLPLIVLPFFTYFWNKIFHQLLFNNDFWLLSQDDISYYLFNDLFFITFIILFYLISLTILLIIFFILKRKKID